MHFGLFTPTKWMDNYISTRHSASLTPQPSTYKTANMCCVQQRQKVAHFNMQYKLSTSHGLDRPHLPCSVVIKLQSPTTWLLHVHQHALHAHAALLPSATLLCAQNLLTKPFKMAQDAYRDGVKVMWHHSHLVWLDFWGFHSYMHLFLFAKTLYMTDK